MLTSVLKKPKEENLSRGWCFQHIETWKSDFFFYI